MRFGGAACLSVMVSACSLTTPLDDLTTGGTGGANASSSSATAISSSASTGSSAVGGGVSVGGSGGAEPEFHCSNNGTHMVQDAFDDNVIGNPPWSWYESSSAANISEELGTLNVAIGAASQTIWADIRTLLAYDLTDCYVHVRVHSVLSDAPGNFVALTLYRPGTDLDYLEILKVGSNLNAATWEDGIANVAGSVSYDSQAHAWWRIREDGGDVVFETSSDGVRYQQLGSAAAPFDVTALELSLISGTNGTSEAAGVARYDDFNVPP